MATLLEKCNNIKNDKDTNLKPENLKAGVTCLGVTGTLTELDTSDATATENDIVQGKTAYINGEKIEGAVMELRSTIGTSYESLFPYKDGDDDLVGFGDIGIDVLMRHGSGIQLNIPIEEIVNTIGLTSDQITNGNTVLGVEGTGAGNAKSFETIEEMYMDTTAKENDLAIIYKNDIQSINVNSHFDKAIFPETVILPTAFDGNVELFFRATDDTIMFDSWGGLTSERFELTCFFDEGSIIITYESSDGITYNRTTFRGDTVTDNIADFKTEIYYGNASTWDDNVGYFIQTGSMTFNGLFQYKPDTSLYYVEDTWRREIILPNFKIARFANGGGGWADWSYKKLLIEVEEIDENGRLLSAFVYGDYQDIGTLQISSDGNSIACTSKTSVPKYAVTVDWDTYELVVDLDSKEDIAAVNSECILVPLGTPCISPVNILLESGEGIYVLAASYDHKLKYQYADTQLTIVPSDLLPNKIGYGAQGVVIGDGSIYEKLDAQQIHPNTTFNDVSAGIYAKTKALYKDLQPTILTDRSQIDKTIYIIPKNENNELLIDHSQISDLSFIYQSANNLIRVEGFENNIATNAYGLFSNCANLEYADISGLTSQNLTSIMQMFTQCHKLKTAILGPCCSAATTAITDLFASCHALTKVDVSQFNTSNITNFTSMFHDCNSLVELDLSNFNTEKVTDFDWMFYNCTSLKKLDLSSFVFSGQQASSAWMTFKGIPSDCLIYVKDQTAKDWVLTVRNDFTNVQIKSLGGGEEQ